MSKRKGKVYATRYGKVRVTRIKGGGRVVTDAKGNLISVKDAVIR